jgi:hypothetical protein
MMRRNYFICISVLLTWSAGGVSAQEEIRSELEKRTTAARAKIDDLFAQRDHPIPVVRADSNPFYRVAGFVPEDPGATSDEEVVFVPQPREEAELLDAIAASLKINSIVTYNNRDMIVINHAPTSAGRMIRVDFEGKSYFIRVEEIFSNRVVLSLGETFTILPIAIETEAAEGSMTPTDPSLN